ncbi:hypothetical protein [Vibrio sp. D431a]|uniref:hypothetical protein n=1 Tax=Vibrio sp. D431a TaxID=2837388 RepID=UPI00255768B5|nr:hypothetical protein [Vibrio sp. D431a]MDK9790103.1 hypothetical protein [Vibrio sp. D431a]
MKKLCVSANVDGAFAFSDKAFDDLEVTFYKSRETLAYMTPEDFLAVAEKGFDSSKEGVCKGVIESGEGFTSIPFLTFEHDGKGNARVVGHEGRHRAMVLFNEGVSKIPVVLKSAAGGEGMSIRWGSQDGGFDALSTHGQVLPLRLISEEGDCSIAMPDSLIFEQNNLNKPNALRPKSI